MRGVTAAGRVAIVLLAVAALAVAVWLYVAYGSFVLARVASADRPIHSDFDSFWLSARALLSGRDIYDTTATDPNLNPPLMSLVLAPLGLLGFPSAYRVFVLVTVAMVVGSMVAVAAQLRIRATVSTPVTVVVLVSSPVLATLGLGQIYGLLMAGLAAAWVAQRRGHLLVEGAAIGLVAAIKPSLVPLLLLPALRRRWPTLAAAVVTGLVATAAGALAAGLSSFPTWLGLVLGRPVQTYFDNASLPATILRLTSVNDWARPLVVLPGGYPAGLAIGAALLAVTLWVVRRPPTDGGPDAALWTVAAAALLLSPLTWNNYLMVLMPGVLVLAVRGRWPSVALMLALALIGMEWPSLWYGADGTAPALPLSLYCGSLLVYWAALLASHRVSDPLAGPLTADGRAVAARGSPTVSRPGP